MFTISPQNVAYYYDPRAVFYVTRIGPSPARISSLINHPYLLELECFDMSQSVLIRRALRTNLRHAEFGLMVPTRYAEAGFFNNILWH